MPQEVENKEVKGNIEQKAKSDVIDSKKIDLYINNNDNDQEQGISLMNIFGYLKRRFHIFIYVILITFILGLLIPYIVYYIKDKKDVAVAVLALDYEGAEQGLAPDGSSLDISYIKSSYIIQNALSSVELSKNVSVASIQSNIVITGILTDATKETQEKLDNLLEVKSSEYAKLLQTFTLEYRAQYIITLNNGFKDGNSKTKLPSEEVSILLSSIIESYVKYYNDTYLDHTLPNNQLGAVDTDTLDYLDILDEIYSSLTYLEGYCEAKSHYLNDFRTSDGLSFSDLASVIYTIKSSDIDYIYSYIYLNNVFKDSHMALTNYKYQKREATLELSEVNESITTIKNSIDNYKTDKVVISSTDNNQLQEVEITSDYYNELVGRLTALNNQKSTLEERITILDNRITKLEGEPATAEQVAKASEYVDNALNNAKSIYNIVNKHSQELFSSNAYNNSFMHTIITSEADSLKDNLKLFAIGAGAGLFIGLVIWFSDAFILEFKNSKKDLDAKEASINNEK